MARYRAARRAPWWLRAPGLVVERLFFDPAGDPPAGFMEGGVQRAALRKDPA